MGGAACSLIIHAVVRYKEVPTTPEKQAELEQQLRRCYANTTIADAVVENEPKAEHLWTILSKRHLNAQDLSELLKGLPEYE